MTHLRYADLHRQVPGRPRLVRKQCLSSPRRVRWLLRYCTQVLQRCQLLQVILGNSMKSPDPRRDMAEVLQQSCE